MTARNPDINWTVVKGSHTAHCCFEWSILDSDGYSVAEVMREDESIARLLASAPRLLSMNRELVAVLEVLARGDDVISRDELADLLRRAKEIR